MGSDTERLGVQAGDDYEFTAGAAPPRLVRLAKQGSCFIALQEGEWGVASRTLARLRKMLRGEAHDGVYRIEANYHEDKRQTPDIFLRHVVDPREVDVRLTAEEVRILRSITRPRATQPDAVLYHDWSVEVDRKLKAALESS